MLKPIDSTMKKHFCKHVFKILIGELFCSVFRDYFETMEKIHVTITAYRKSTQFNGGKVFNNLPHKCRAATSLDDFFKILDEL